LARFDQKTLEAYGSAADEERAAPMLRIPVMWPAATLGQCAPELTDFVAAVDDREHPGSSQETAYPDTRWEWAERTLSIER